MGLLNVVFGPMTLCLQAFFIIFCGGMIETHSTTRESLCAMARFYADTSALLVMTWQSTIDYFFQVERQVDESTKRTLIIKYNHSVKLSSHLSLKEENIRRRR